MGDKKLPTKSNKQFDHALGPLPTIWKEFDSYLVQYHSDTFISPKSPYNKYSINWAEIYCYFKGQFAGRMVFHDREIIDPNTYYGPYPNYDPELNFHISRFNDIINILRYEKRLGLFLNPNNLNGHLDTIDLEPVGEQE